MVFFAGSARYLLPMAAPVALLASRLRPRWLAAGFAVQLALGLGLAAVNYQHWDGYRQFAESLRGPAAGHRVWVDGEWGLRYYLEADGALPLKKTQRLRPGDIVVSSELGAAVNPVAPFAPLRTAEIRPAIPLRLIGLESHSGYSTVSRGFWPFGISAGADRPRARRRGRRAAPHARIPAHERPRSRGPDRQRHLRSRRQPVSLDVAQRRRGAEESPGRPAAARDFHHPGEARARRVALLLDGREVASQTYPAPGTYTLESPPVRAAGAVATVEIASTGRSSPRRIPANWASC